MSSPSIAFGVCAQQTSTGGNVRLQAQLRTWLPVLAFSMVFAIESTSYFGSDRTSEPLQRVFEAIFGYDVCVYWDLIHGIIRKTGHFLGYGMFSLVCFRACWIELRGVALRFSRQLGAHGLAILATFLVASADEFHQTFLPNRSGQFSDVMLDCCGAVALGLVLFLVMQVKEGRRKAKTSMHRGLEPGYAGASV
ncbi:MAG: VanZ family protein [Terracidiphilus sp.]